MKIIFLDIDGVLNNELFYREKHQHVRYNELKDISPDGAWDIDSRCIGLLNHIVDKTKAKIVISSSWRHSKTIEQFKELFQYFGFKGEIIDKTPYLQFKSNILGGYDYSVPRGCEIKAWLEINKDRLGNKMSKVKYVILDDDSDMLYWQRSNYFQVDPYSGLTPNLCYRVINFLNNDDL